jgi:TonB family protein
VVFFGLSGLRFQKPESASSDVWEAGRRAFQVIEVPDDTPVERPIVPTDLVSDRVARAADMNPEHENESADPYSDGNTEIREFEDAGVEIARTGMQVEAVTPDLPKALDPSEAGEPVGEVLQEELADYVVDEGADRRNGTPGRPATFRNLLSDAGREGGLSFNTYDWDFAPYMLAMKRAIESHLFPPYAFTHMGLVSGTNIIRFTVMPDGRVRGLEILGSDAHFSLDRTSVRAIESSVPFLPLPREFPEEYLEVTAHFSYVILGRN